MFEGQSSASTVFDPLAGHEYLSLVTYRANGEGVPTPVWFAQVGDILYITTMEGAGKVKRLRRNPNVTVTPCDMHGKLLGPTMTGYGRIVEGAEIDRALDALDARYDLRARYARGDFGGGQGRVYLAISHEPA